MTTTTTAPTRDELIRLCERGVVPQDRWSNRDTSGAQRQLGECLALLKAGCDFGVDHETKHGAHWVTVIFRGFDYFEYGHDGTEEHDRFYVPTAESLDRANGGDWY